MRILFTTQERPGYIGPPWLSPDQINCGPHYEDRIENGRVVALRSPAGEYDFAEVLARIPPEQRPDLVVVRTDASRRNVPRNFDASGCRAVFAVVDTHHMAKPIQWALDYARGEPFYAIMFQFTPHHAHFFIEAGLERVFYLPGFDLTPTAVPSNVQLDIPISFVGTLDPRHARRSEVLRSLAAAGLPLLVTHATPLQARTLHARSRVNLNCSLNGDFNLRVFEVMASGGCLLTDRLSPQSGLERFFTDGKDLVTYESAADCVDKARALLADPRRSSQIARAGKETLERRFSRKQIVGDFFALLKENHVRPEFDLRNDRRTLLGREPDINKLKARIGLYELLQAVHHGREYTRVLAAPGVDARLLCDSVDLPRLGIAVDVTGSEGSASALEVILQSSEIVKQIDLLYEGGNLAERHFDLLLATQKELGAGYDRKFRMRNPQSLLMITDLAIDQAAPGMPDPAGWRRITNSAPIFQSVPAG